ncbi:hypothetical protein [Brevibacterium aurantiacum]|uniref:hypothetical protein n=1 Tax=Brevibacterium aurantiacum TaxID=273384 RepID=UPI0018671C49|nr:hypothetical protein [Brevibacterium aurantiacum]
MDNRYLEGTALIAAQKWLLQEHLPAAEESAEELIQAYYPGGLHWFITQNFLGQCQS